MYKKIFIFVLFVLLHCRVFGSNNIEVFFYVDGSLVSLPTSLLETLQHTPENEMDEVIIKTLIHSGVYNNVETNQYQDSDANTFIVVSAKISQKIHSITLHGISESEEYKFRRIVDTSIGTIYTPEILNILEEKVETELHNAGYLHVKVVDIQASSIPNNLVDINIYINKGNPCIIEQIIMPTAYLNFRKLFDLPFEVGSQCNVTAINDSLQQMQERYWADGYLQAVVAIDRIEYTIDKSKAVIYIKVDKGQKTILKINDHSYNIFKSDFLDPKEGGLTYSDLIQLNDSTLRSIITTFYQKQGYASVRVSPPKRFRDKNKNHVISFDVIKGPPVKINSVRFVGGELPISEATIRTELEITKGKIFDKDNLVTYTEQLRKILFRYGYNDAFVYPPDFYFSTDKTLVNLTLRYDKNTQYIVSEMSYVDFPPSLKISKNKYDSTLKIGDPLNLEKRQEILDNLHEIFLENGYLYAKVESKIHYEKKLELDPQTPVEVIIYPTPGPVVKIRKILVEGDTFGKEDTVIQISQLRKGMIFTQEKLNIAQENILKHVLFSSVIIDFLDPKTLEKQESEVDLVIKVRGRRGFDFGLAPSYGTGTGYRANVNLNINNLTPHGLRLTLNAIIRQEVQQQNFELSSSKQLLGQTYSIGLHESLFKFFAIQTPIDLSVVAGYQVIAMTLLNRQLDTIQINSVWRPRLWGANVNLSFALDQQNYVSLSPPNSATIIFDTPTITLRHMAPKITIDTRDNAGWPTRAYFFDGIIDFARFGFGSNVQFTNYIFNMKTYFPIYKQLSMGVYFGLNQINDVKNKNSKTLTPPSDFRTYLIDDSIIRGFPSNYTQVQTGPLLWLRSANPSTKCSNQLQPLGGTKLVYLKAEARYRINSNFGLVLFGDSGGNYFTTYESNKIQESLQALTGLISSPSSQCLLDQASLVATPAIEGGSSLITQYWKKTYMSTGVGLRIILGSFMTVKLDYGYPIKDPSQNQEGCVSINTALNASTAPKCVSRIQTSMFFMPQLKYVGAWYFGFEAKL